MGNEAVVKQVLGFLSRGLIATALASSASLSFDEPALAAALFPLPEIGSDLGSVLAATAADLNADGLPDLISVGVGEELQGAVEVRLALAAGDYGPITSYPAGLLSRALAVGDLDGDGALDVVVVNADSDDVTIWFGRGDGRLSARRDLPAGVGPYEIALADFDDSGSLDIAVTNGTFDGVTVLLGQGDGGFAPPLAAGRTGIRPRDLIAHDVDGDGIVDLLVVCDTSGAVTVLLGAGDGRFRSEPPGIFAGGSAPKDIALGDLDDDGAADLLVTYRLGSGIGHLRGRGDGRFDLQDPILSAGGYDDIRLSDLDGDGRLDIVVLGEQDDHVAVLRGLGDARFGELTVLPSEPAAASIDVVDLDQDGRLDVLVGCRAVSEFPPDDGELLLLRGLGDASFSQPDVLAGDRIVRAATVGDATHDGIADVVALLEGDLGVTIWPGLGEGEFGDPLFVPTGFLYHTAVRVADLDLDGLADLLLSSQTGGRVTVVRASAPGAFEPYDEFLMTFGFSPTDPRVADLDADGWLDIAMANAPVNGVSIMSVTDDGTLFGPTHVPLGLAADSLAVADIDGDGALDLVTASSTQELLGVHRGDGRGGFTPGDVYTVDGAPRGVAVGDLDGDGDLDLVVGRPGHPFQPDSWIGVLLGHGDGSFGSLVTREAENELADIDLADLNRDGVLDLVTTHGKRDVSVWIGKGTGDFRPPTSFLTGAFVGALSIGDLDADDLPDLLVGSTSETGLWVHLNQLGE